MVPTHWSIPTYITKNKSSSFKKCRISSFFSVYPSSLISSYLKTTVQLHFIFLLCAPSSCVVVFGNFKIPKLGDPN